MFWKSLFKMIATSIFIPKFAAQTWPRKAIPFIIAKDEFRKPCNPVSGFDQRSVWVSAEVNLRIPFAKVKEVAAVGTDDRVERVVLREFVAHKIQMMN